MGPNTHDELSIVPLFVTVVGLVAPPSTLHPPALEGKSTVRLVPDRVKVLVLDPQLHDTVLEPEPPVIDALVTLPDPGVLHVLSPKVGDPVEFW